jgi:p-hydroxybenzoate 3-monooxygenase
VETQVAIIGAGPAGLLLSHLLHLAGIESVVLEDRSRDYVEQRVRAGVLEHGTVELLKATGLGERLSREGIAHHGISIGFDGSRHRIALSELTGGRAITIYGQQELVKDLIAARLDAGGTIHFEVEDVELSAIESPKPIVRYKKHGSAFEVRADFVAGCDGSQGISRGYLPNRAAQAYEREYPFAWLGILAAVAPSSDELVYARHERGFALHSLRSPRISRLYLQVDREEQLGDWSDDRVWEELRLRLGTKDGWTLQDGPILERSITVHRSFVLEPMQYGRLFLAGDAAHIVPPTGAKGLNLAVADVRVLAHGIVDWYRRAHFGVLDHYTERCLSRVWRVQQFSAWMTRLLHRLPDSDAFEERLVRAELEWTCTSTAAAQSLAENYVGLPFTPFD